MDNPCGSQPLFADEDADAEVSNILPLAELQLDAGGEEQGKRDSRTLDEDNGNDADLPSVEDIIAECEIRLKRYLKWQKMAHNIAAVRGRPLPDSPIDDRSTVFIDFNRDLMDYKHCDSAFRDGRREVTVDGSWLFLSQLSGGWSYDDMKQFFVDEFGVKCLKNMPERVTPESEYKAVVKFRSSDELNQVVMTLKDRQFYNKFLFFSFEKIPLTYYETESELDSDDDEARPGLVLPIVKEA